MFGLMELLHFLTPPEHGAFVNPFPGGVNRVHMDNIDTWTHLASRT